ncbi:hypothetical protein [Paenibacillus radicis (ex Gao et al. 2016)]|uniref:Uncharacterized protein n=1 Tax=Paenibacillus radicis (ex Gao et al. 2016) TaxID=1737354 RepID=A0A917MAV0_9BACL|nr:hypothetical protein [Paenibacillus radicis (ex Gao et al. 2016)]GGG88533.1 hypothetical protein GCM10010918_53850 [Paenibacillus radicis (ex Gao et al. 2016)]
MLGKTICVLLLASAMLIHDIPKVKAASNRDRLVYIAMLAPLLYLAVVFLTAQPWPNLDRIFNLFTGPAKLFIRWLNPMHT